jgi:hypothetical protein
MNLFRSEEHAKAWETSHPDLQGQLLTLEQALAWVTFVGKDRPNFDYIHPRATGTLGPFLKSLGLTGDWWKPK